MTDNDKLTFGSETAREILRHDIIELHTKRAEERIEVAVAHSMTASMAGDKFAEIVFLELYKTVYDYSGDISAMYVWFEAFYGYLFDRAKDTGMLPPKYRNLKKKSKKQKKELKRLWRIIKKYGEVQS